MAFDITWLAGVASRMTAGLLSVFDHRTWRHVSEKRDTQKETRPYRSMGGSFIQ